jgi:hypothetical protein
LRIVHVFGEQEKMNHYPILAGVLLFIASITGAWLSGSHHVQKKWDLENERLQTIADLAIVQRDAAARTVAEQHKKDIEHAKSQAGRTAIATWLKSHGLLPDGTPVSGSGGGQNAGSRVTDAAGGEHGTGGSIEGFALRCGEDALTVEAWQQLCRSNPATCESVIPAGTPTGN